MSTIRPDGTELTQLTDNAGKEEWATQPTWTPDGTQIAFTHISRTPTGGLDPDSFQVAFIDRDGTDMRILDGGYKARGSGQARSH